MSNADIKPLRHGLVTRFLNRYPSTNVPVFAIGIIVYGFLILVGPQKPFNAPLYQLVFQTVHRPVWGVAFMLAGVAALIRVRIETAMLLTFVISLWATNWLVATIAHPDTVPAFSPVLVTAVAVSLAISVARRGARFFPRMIPESQATRYLDIALAEAHARANLYVQAESMADRIEHMVAKLSNRLEQ